jgi:hypothetical protein
LIVIKSPVVNSQTIWPSVLKIVDGLGEIILTSMVTDIGKINDRLVRVCGQIGVNAITSAVGKATAPPAASE